jgi:putative hydrolase of the HAD superfamily
MAAADGQSLIDRIRALSAPAEPIPTGLTPLLSRLDDIRAVIFDVYGTLFVSGSGDVGTASAASNVEHFSEALDAMAIDASAEEAMAAYFAAIETDHAARKASGVDHPEVDIIDVWRQALVERKLDDGALKRIAVEYECRASPTWPMPELLATLAALRGRVRLGIVSNAQFFTPLLFEAHLSAAPADVGFEDALCVFSYELGQAKPSPILFEKLLAALQTDGIEPGQALYVGNDVRNDIAPARSLGMRTALFAGDARSLRLRADDPDCGGAQPDAVVTALPQILELLAP